MDNRWVPQIKMIYSWATIAARPLKLFKDNSKFKMQEFKAHLLHKLTQTNPYHWIQISWWTKLALIKLRASIYLIILGIWLELNLLNLIGPKRRTLQRLIANHSLQILKRINGINLFWANISKTIRTIQLIFLHK